MKMLHVVLLNIPNKVTLKAKKNDPRKTEKRKKKKKTEMRKKE